MHKTANEADHLEFQYVRQIMKQITLNFNMWDICDSDHLEFQYVRHLMKGITLNFNMWDS